MNRLPDPLPLDQYRQRLGVSKRDWVIAGLCLPVLLVCGLCNAVMATTRSPRPIVAPTALPAIQKPLFHQPEATFRPFPTKTSRPTRTATEALPTDTPKPFPTDTKAAPTAAPKPTARPPTALPAKFTTLNPDEDRDCNEFSSQAEAQAYWKVYRTGDRPNPGRLDGNGNGIVCEDTDRAAPKPLMQAPPPAQPSRPCDTSLVCADFSSWDEMNAWWNACGRPAKYDRNGDGVPCESLR